MIAHTPDVGTLSVSAWPLLHMMIAMRDNIRLEIHLRTLSCAHTDAPELPALHPAPVARKQIPWMMMMMCAGAV